MTTSQSTYAQRFAQHEQELRNIAASLGRADIFDRDLAGQAGMEPVPARSDEALRDALEGIGWYLGEELERYGEQGYAQDPRQARYAAIALIIEAAE